MKKTVNWLQIGCFYAISLVVSYVIIQQFAGTLGMSFRGLGPLIGTLAVLGLLPKEKRPKISIFGPYLHKSIFALSIPFLLVALIGIQYPFAADNIYINGLAIVAGGLLYAFTEEIGWRGYLQEALSPLGFNISIFLIGALWYFWHFSWASPDTTLTNELLFLGICIFGSWGMGIGALQTKSVIIPTCIHFAFNLFFTVDTASFELAIPIVCLVIWVYMSQRWESQPLTPQAT